jgi:peptidoglycan/xylan/chitin deacetylase (PgdA/CDA1 family)
MRHRLLAFLALSVCSTAAHSQSLSLTFDDGLDPSKQQNVRLWNAQIIAGLREAGVTSMVFPSLSHIGGDAGMDLIRAWAEAGHYIGNHTSAHRSLSSPKMTLDEFTAEPPKSEMASDSG